MACLGGLRRPIRAVRRAPFLAAAGQRIRRALDLALADGWHVGGGSDLTELFGYKRDAIPERFALHDRVTKQVKDALYQELKEESSDEPLATAAFCIWDAELTARIA